MFVQGDTFCSIFKKLRKFLLNAPIVTPRGQKTRELLSFSFELTNPRNRLIYHPQRKYNYAFNIAEMFSHVAGINSVQYVDFWNSNYKQYSDNGINFYGNYGERLKLYIPALINKLKYRADTRQATLSIYNSADMMQVTKDTPCTLALDFKVRDKKLHLHVFMRSNDLIFGLQYDLVAFTLMQEIIANTIGVELGNYNHTTASLHIYERHWELLRVMQNIKHVEMSKVTEVYEDILNYANEANRMAIDSEYYSSIDVHLMDSLMLYKRRKFGFLNELDISRTNDYLAKIMRLK